MRHRGWITLLLISPFAILVLGMQVALSVGAISAVQAGLGAGRGSPSSLERGMSGLATAAHLTDRLWSSMPARLLALNPLSLGAVDDVSAAAKVADAASGLLEPAGDLANVALGLDGRPALVVPGGVDTDRIPDVAAPLQQAQTALTATGTALAEVPTSGPVGRPVGTLAESMAAVTADLTQMNAAALLALPDLPEALGASGPKRYLICALNDGEIFASGGAPLSAVMIQVVDGRVSAPITGQLESKLSPNNPSIVWNHASGLPWRRATKRYPFVNSNFHPDFRTTSVDMRRAWAALGYPKVDGVATIDLDAASTVLDWAGSTDAHGYGVVGGDTLIQKVLVDAYRDFNSPAGVIERHARNDAMVDALGHHFAKPWNLLPAVRGAMRAMPERHIQASFSTPGLTAAVASLDADGALASGPGDLVGAFSQSAPSKISIFQERSIDQEVVLDAQGGAQVTRTTAITNAIPEGLSGNPESTHGHLALRARMRVAYRVPLASTHLSISTGSTPALTAIDKTGPFPDDRGGAVMWQGHETAPRDTTTVTLTYRLPPGTFTPGSYELWADPQPMVQATSLRVHVSAAPGVTLPPTAGWTADASGLTWQGSLVRQLHLKVG